MTLEEAIEHADERAGDETCCDECRHDHAQLAEWLRELKELRVVWRNLMIAYEGVCRRYNEADDRYIATINYLYGKVARMDDANIALRQLAQDMWACIGHIDEVTGTYYSCTGCPLDDTAACDFEGRMVALGIEVG